LTGAGSAPLQLENAEKLESGQVRSGQVGEGQVGGGPSQGGLGRGESGQGESGDGAADPCSDSLRDVTSSQVGDACVSQRLF